jgi:hypothetical protein
MTPPKLLYHGINLIQLGLVIRVHVDPSGWRVEVQPEYNMINNRVGMGQPDCDYYYYYLKKVK